MPNTDVLIILDNISSNFFFSSLKDFEGLEVVGSKIKEESTITGNKLLVHGDSNGCEIPDNEQTLSYSPVENSRYFSATDH